MSLARWNQFTLKQQFGNIAAELGRAKKQLELNNLINYNLSMERVIEMLDYQKTNYNNNETFRFYEFVAGIYQFPNLGNIQESIDYTLSFVK